MIIPILETQRLSIRQLTLDDADFVLVLLNDPVFLQNIGDKNVRSIEDARTYILTGPAASYERNGFGLYLVALKDSGEPVGICGLVKREELEDVDIGYAFLPEHRLKGYAVESAAGIMSVARNIPGLDRIVAITVPHNRGSIRVLEKIGFSFERMVKLSADSDDLCLYASDCMSA